MAETKSETTPERYWVIKSPWGLHPQPFKPTKSEGVEYVRKDIADTTVREAVEKLTKVYGRLEAAVRVEVETYEYAMKSPAHAQEAYRSGMAPRAHNEMKAAITVLESARAKGEKTNGEV